LTLGIQPVNVTVIVTAFRRVDQTIETVRRIKACSPPPDEVLVHVDANEHKCADAIRAAFPEVPVMVSSEAIGPGGGRNKLVAAAQNEWVASFDDDSYPIDTDFFARAAFLMMKFPETALVTGAIFNRGEQICEAKPVVCDTGSFASGATVFRRSEFLKAGGFVPLVVAYGMEEQDLTLRLLERGRLFKYSPWLRIYHDTDLSHHASANVNAGVIANLALLAYARYPVSYWPYGALQVGNRIVWSIRNGRFSGLASGIAQVPVYIWRHRRLRRPVSAATLRTQLELRARTLHPFAPPNFEGLAAAAGSETFPSTGK
jgi:GT2 family glycosyltransferase